MEKPPGEPPVNAPPEIVAFVEPVRQSINPEPPELPVEVPPANEPPEILHAEGEAIRAAGGALSGSEPDVNEPPVIVTESPTEINPEDASALTVEEPPVAEPPERLSVDEALVIPGPDSEPTQIPRDVEASKSGPVPLPPATRFSVVPPAIVMVP
jgi:hypothetical protein